MLRTFLGKILLVVPKLVCDEAASSRGTGSPICGNCSPQFSVKERPHAQM